jgi:hydrogenase maturation protease
MRNLAIGIGNPFRHDDAAGIEVAKRLRELSVRGLEVHITDGDPGQLLELWDGAETTYVIDAVSSGETPGTVHRFEVGDEPVPDRPRRDSTHAVRLGEAVELARVLDRLPRRLVLIGIVGEDFEAGVGLTPEVERATTEVAGEIAVEAVTAAGGDR